MARSLSLVRSLLPVEASKEIFIMKFLSVLKYSDGIPDTVFRTLSEFLGA